MKIIMIKRGKKLEIRYGVLNTKGEYDEQTIKSGDSPRPEFYEALSGLNSYLKKILELPEDAAVYTTAVGISYYKGGDEVGVELMGERLLENAKRYVSVKTPKVYTDITVAKDLYEGDKIPEGMMEVVRRVTEEATAYVGGARASREEVDEEKDVEQF